MILDTGHTITWTEGGRKTLETLKQPFKKIVIVGKNLVPQSSMWQWHILYPKSMTQLVSESVILWQRTVEGGSCFLPPQPSWAKLWRKTRHKTESSQKSTMFPTKRAKKKTVTRLSILRECRVTWTVSARESLCLQNTNCWEARPDTCKAVSSISELYSEHSRQTELSELENV